MRSFRKASMLSSLGYLKFRPFDTETAEGRTRERYRLAAWAAAGNFLSTLLGLLAILITVPLTLPYLGEERFGVWMTIASLAATLSFLDLGIGNALINHVASASAANDPPRLRQAISRGLLLLF